MKNIKYKEYSKKEMIKIIQKDGFVFVETSLGDNYVIKKNDIADFIELETQRTAHKADLSIYLPGEEEPILTTFGCFLNKVNSVLRDEIIDRLVLLQTTNKNPKKVKVFNNNTFCNLSKTEMGIKNGKILNFDELYGKYMNGEKTYEN